MTDSHVRIWILERIILDIGSLSRNLKLEGVALRGDFLYLGLRREGDGITRAVLIQISTARRVSAVCCSSRILFPPRRPIFYLLRRELYVAVVKFGYNTEQVLGCFLVVGEQIPKLQLFLLYYSLKIPPHLGTASQPVLLFF